MRHLFILVLAFSSLLASARQRTSDEMRTIAAYHLQTTAAVKGFHVQAPISEPVCALSDASFEIYNDSNGQGFVIVTRDDAVSPIIGYGSGQFEVAEMPCCLKWWLKQVSANLSEQPSRVSGSASATYTPVAPMLTTKWGQSFPYNYLTPTFDDENAPTGCVATALAQVLNWNQYPSSVSFEGTYYLEGDDEPKTKTISSTYSYPYLTAYGYYLPRGDMDYKDAELIEFTREEAIAVATLMRDCGYAVGMEYGKDGSGSSTMNSAIGAVDVFNYPSEAVKVYVRDFYSDAEWHQLIHDELERGYPILYGGNDESFGGHAFVLHGRDEQGLVCVSWGWDGVDDGYYDIDLLNPTDLQFSEGQQMVTGLHPQALDDDQMRSLFVTFQPYTLKVMRGKVAINLVEGLYNLSPITFQGWVSLVVENLATGKVARYNIATKDEEFPPYYGFYSGLQQTTFAPEKGQTYRAYLATKMSDEASWQFVRTTGGPIYYEIYVDSQGKSSFSEMNYFTTSIGSVMASQPADTTTRVYDLQGKLVYTSPTKTFNLWDVPARGVLIVRQGDTVRKIVR